MAHFIDTTLYIIFNQRPLHRTRIQLYSAWCIRIESIYIDSQMDTIIGSPLEDLNPDRSQYDSNTK